MKLLFLFLSACLAVGRIIPTQRSSLLARVNQQLTNPDNDPDYDDPKTGKKTPKSRVLSGVGPDEANNRWFDWDESCANVDQRTKILRTFQYAITLAEWTSGHLDQLQRGLPNPVGSSVNKDNQKFIFDKDPAFAQMFLGQDIRIQYVKETFDIVARNAKSAPDARGGNNPGALRFICSADNKVMNGDGSQPYCGTGGTAAQAIETSPYDPKYAPTIEPKYSFEKSSSITFCPVFFENDLFPNLDAVVGSGDHTLDKVECAERVLLHEYMHLPWTRKMGPEPDYIGYFNAADYAAHSGWQYIKTNPDNYAWLALYAYFNNNNQGCGTDVWPQGQDKPNKL